MSENLKGVFASANTPKAIEKVRSKLLDAGLKPAQASAEAVAVISNQGGASEPNLIWFNKTIEHYPHNTFIYVTLPNTEALKAENKELKERLNRNVSLLVNETLSSENEALKAESVALKARVAELEKDAARWNLFTKALDEDLIILDMMEKVSFELFQAGYGLHKTQVDQLMDEVERRFKLKGGAT